MPASATRRRSAASPHFWLGVGGGHVAVGSDAIQDTEQWLTDTGGNVEDLPAGRDPGGVEQRLVHTVGELGHVVGPLVPGRGARTPHFGGGRLVGRLRVVLHHVLQIAGLAVPAVAAYCRRCHPNRRVRRFCELDMY